MFYANQYISFILLHIFADRKSHVWIVDILAFGNGKGCNDAWNRYSTRKT